MKESFLKKIIKNYWPLIGYFLISFIFLYPVLIQSGVPFKYDWFWPLFDMGEYFRVAIDKSNFGLFSSLGRYANIFFAFFGWLKISPNLALKIFLLIIHTVSGYGFYLFASKRVKFKAVTFLAGIAYAFSPYIFIRTIVGFVYSLIAYACLPLFLHIFINRERKRAVDFLSLGLLFTFVVSQIQAGVLLLILILIITLFERKKVKLRLKELVIIFATVFLFALPWIIYMVLNGSVGQKIDGNQVTTLNYIANLPHSLRNVLFLSDHIITRDYFYSFAREPITVIGFVIFYLVAMISIFDKKNRSLVLPLIISSVVIIPFSIGPTGIFAGFYSFVFSYLPQIAIFRETYHLIFLLAFNLTTLFAIGLNFVSDGLKKNRPFFWLIKIIAASSILIVIAPYLGFDYAGYFNLQEIPDEYRQADDFFQENTDYCKKVYYPPNLGFIRFASDPTAETSASNSDTIAWDFNLPRVTDAASVLSVVNDEMYRRNHLTSQFLEFSDNGEFASLAREQGVDCVIIRDDLTSLYFLANNVWRDPSFDVRLKWMNQNMLYLAENKNGLRLEKQFGDKIYLYKIDVNWPTIQPVSQSTLGSLPEGQKLAITDWASNYDWYTEGWARGRYNFWRKHLFAQLEQDFIYTNKPGSEIIGKINKEGSFDLMVRYLDGGDSGKFEIRMSKFETIIEKESNEERFVVKNLGEVEVKKGDTITIKNVLGENAIADIVLVKK